MKTLPNNPPVKEELDQPLDFSDNPELEENYNSEKETIILNTEQKLAIETISSIKWIILSHNEIKEKWSEKTFDEVLADNGYDGYKINDIIDSTDYTRELINLLKNKKDINPKEKELLAYLEPLESYNIRSKTLWVDMENSSILSIIKNKTESFAKEHKKSYEDWEENEINKDKEKSWENNVVENNWTVEKPITNFDIKNYWYQYNKENNQLFINWKDGPINIPKEDQEIVENSKESMNNYASFSQTLNELKLLNILPYITQIIRSSTEIQDMWIDLENNYLDSKEQIKILNIILKWVWKETIKATKINEFKNIFINKYSTLWKFQNNFKKWDSTIEEEFFQKYINWYSQFQISKFNTNISNTQKNSN